MTAVRDWWDGSSNCSRCDLPGAVAHRDPPTGRAIKPLCERCWGLWLERHSTFLGPRRSFARGSERDHIDHAFRRPVEQPDQSGGFRLPPIFTGGPL